jgi:phosphatidylinositol glycan class Z
VVVTFLLFLLLDSLYYGEITLLKLWDLTMNWSDWKCTPFNFVMYNAVPGNLDRHGTHPLYLHTLVNLPLLYGPLGND